MSSEQKDKSAVTALKKLIRQYQGAEVGDVVVISREFDSRSHHLSVEGMVVGYGRRKSNNETYVKILTNEGYEVEQSVPQIGTFRPDGKIRTSMGFHRSIRIVALPDSLRPNFYPSKSDFKRTNNS
ncbi:MAG TPA: hypothetical protein VI819_03980 [Patescibacteria group bacterium]|nr:hypothetical protein [Patescibacteria group bacterium]